MDGKKRFRLAFCLAILSACAGVVAQAPATAVAPRTETACDLMTDRDASTLVGSALLHRPSASTMKPGIVLDSFCTFTNSKYETGVQARLELMEDAGGASKEFEVRVKYAGALGGSTSEDVSGVGDRAALVKLAGGDLMLVVLRETSVLTLLQRLFDMPPPRRPAMIEAMRQMLSALSTVSPEALTYPTSPVCELLTRKEADAAGGSSPMQPGRPQGPPPLLHTPPGGFTQCMYYFYPSGSNGAPAAEVVSMALFADAAGASGEFDALTKVPTESYEPAEGVGDRAVFGTGRAGNASLVALGGRAVVVFSMVRSGLIANPSSRKADMIGAMKLMLPRATKAAAATEATGSPEASSFTAPAMKFEAVSFKRCEANAVRPKDTFVPVGEDSFGWKCQSTWKMLLFAYGSDRMTGYPAWGDDDVYSFEAKVAPGDVAAWGKLDLEGKRAMVREVLVNSLKLQAHVDTTRLNVLVVDHVERPPEDPGSGSAAQVDAAAATPSKAACDLLTAKEASDAAGSPVGVSPAVPGMPATPATMCRFATVPPNGAPDTRTMPMMVSIILYISGDANAAAEKFNGRWGHPDDPGIAVEPVAGIGDGAIFTSMGPGPAVLDLAVLKGNTILSLGLISTNGKLPADRKPAMIAAMKLMLSRL